MDFESVDGLSLKFFIEEAFTHYFPSSILESFVPTKGGVNNWVFKVSSDGKTFILRIYNNGLRIDKISFEHSILKLLESLSFPFSTPTLIPSPALDFHQTFVPLSNGMLAAVFELIPGDLPKLTCVREIGESSGELSSVMSTIPFSSLPSPCPTPPYYDLWAAHPSIMTREKFESFWNSIEDFRQEPEAPFMTRLFQETLNFEERISYLHSLDLPKGWIHGDLHYDNVLCEDGKLTAILDFEFTAWDYRAMELAICLSKYASEPDPFPYFEEFITGFASKMTYLPKEMEVLTDLISLRILSNVVYFLGRIISRENQVSVLISRGEAYLRRLDWLRENRERLIGLQKTLFHSY